MWILSLSDSTSQALMVCVDGWIYYRICKCAYHVIALSAVLLYIRWAKPLGG